MYITVRLIPNSFSSLAALLLGKPTRLHNSELAGFEVFVCMNGTDVWFLAQCYTTSSVFDALEQVYTVSKCVPVLGNTSMHVLACS